MWFLYGLGAATCDEPIDLDKNHTGKITSPTAEGGQVCHYVFTAKTESPLYLVLDILNLTAADTLTFHNGSVDTPIIKKFSGAAGEMQIKIL